MEPRTLAKLMRKKFILCIPGLLLLVLLTGNLPVRAQAGDPYSLIAAVNQLRSANGLPALQINSVLMSVVQAHTDYQAAIGEVTHVGADGSRPRDRAAAAGYGGGANFFIAENIAGGTNLSVSEVIGWWQGDDLHLNTMLGASYAQIGAGVAVVGDFVYYTIDTAYVSGGSILPLATSGATTVPIYYVITATPKPDGSVVHIVQSGQTLIGIAQAYGISVTEIKTLNNLTSDNIYVGDALLIIPAGTPAPTDTATATATATHVVTSTPQPTRTPTAVPTVTAILTTPTLMPMETSPDLVGNILVVVIAVLGVGGVVLMVIGGLIKRRRG
jgi:LysM repeat protein